MTIAAGGFLDPEHLIELFGLAGILAIVFAESGLLIGFFLPGDSLLFTAGFLASAPSSVDDALHLPLVPMLILLPLAAIAGDQVLLEQEYYSVGGGFIEWKGYTPPKKNPPKYPFATMKELRQHAEKNKLSIAQVVLANEMAIPGRSEKEVYDFIDKISGAMVAIVKSGLKAPEDDVLPGPIKLHSKAAALQRNLKTTAKGDAGRAITQVASYGFAMGEENARGHIIVTAPTAGSAGIIPAVDFIANTEQDREPRSRSLTR